MLKRHKEKLQGNFEQMNFEDGLLKKQRSETDLS